MGQLWEKKQPPHQQDLHRINPFKETTTINSGCKAELFSEDDKEKWEPGKTQLHAEMFFL